MLKEGFENVYHLKGGILKYLEHVPAEESMWKGECFVFDHRTALGHGLAISDVETCFGCRHPLTAEDQSSKDYTPGIHCSHCVHKLTPAQIKSATDRQRQIELAKARGTQHLGATRS